jgi:hypothetical protein
VGAKFFFFTDPALLAPQTAAQAFGPAGTSGGKDQFRVTDLHTSASTDIPAFAVCDGILCAQEDAQGTLTVILKPSQTPPFESPVVSYFIYKGVAKSSLLNLNDGNILDEDAADATDFSKKIAKEWKTQNAASLAGSRAALGLDRDATFLHEDGTTQTAIFTDNDPIDRLFTYPHKTVQLPTVAAGDLIGSFQSTFGFEIVLHRLGYKPKLAFARSADNEVSVTSLAGDNNGAPWVADDYAFFAHWHEKEQVLAFMDPCAYFGSFVQAKMYKKSGSTSGKVKGSDIYQEILQKFANRNIAWLDLRNNYSYSYNLFGLYDDTIRFVSHSDASQTSDKNFRAGSWPILRLAIADVPGSKKRSLHRTKLRLPVGKSSAPAVLVSKGFVTTLGPEKPKYKAPAIEADSADPAFYQPIRLAFLLADDSGQDVFSCSYTRVNIYEKPHAGQPAAGTLDVARGDYLDGVFRLRDLRLDQDFSNNGLRFEVFHEEVFIDLESEFGATYSAAVGIAEDASNIALFTLPTYFLPNDEASEAPVVASWASSTDAEGSFLQWLQRNFSITDLTKATVNPGTANETDVVISRQAPGLRMTRVGLGQLSDLCIIIVKGTDYKSWLQQYNDDSVFAATNWPIFSTLSNAMTKTESTLHFAYREGTLQATGYKADSSAGTVSQYHASLNTEVLQYADL